MINRESKGLLHCKKLGEGRKKKKKACGDQVLLLSSSPRSQHVVITSNCTEFRPAPFQTFSAYSDSVHEDLSTGRSKNMQEVINLTIKRETNRTPLTSPLKTNTGLSYSLRHKTAQDPTPKNRGFHSKSQSCIFPGKTYRCFLARGCPQRKTQSEQQTNILSFSGARAPFSYPCSPPLGEQHLAIGCNQIYPATIWSYAED